MSSHTKKYLFACAFTMVSMSACLQNTGVTTKSDSALTKGQANCLLPDAAAVKNIGLRLEASAVVVGPEFCAKPENYECYVRKFSPAIADGKSVIDECTHVGDLGGNVCLKMNANFFNTREVSRAPGTAAAASLSGGEFNRSEYVCHNRELKDADVFLATGEGDLLKDALAASYAKCAGVAPRLAHAE